MFTKMDKEVFVKKGINQADVTKQLERFNNGFDPIRLDRPALIGDGILKLPKEDLRRYEELFEGTDNTTSKFVPASGAATRMFKDLMQFKKEYDESEEAYSKLIKSQNNPVFHFLKNLESFAFYDELSSKFLKVHGVSLNEAHLKREYLKIIDVLLSEHGLNYKNHPKGVLAFHRYENQIRTPIEEQLIEGWNHKLSDKLNIHFTVSPNHEESFQILLDEIRGKLDFGHSINVSFSFQETSTDTIAVDPLNKPIRNEKGELLFRPAGHGALLQNLNQVQEQIVFIKNIDNVLHDRYKKESVRYKKILAGVLIEYQQRIFHLLERIDTGEQAIVEAQELLKELGVTGVPEDQIFDYLNRPIRVCGMVKNEGEPGGGPFWIRDQGIQSLQIVESAQVDISDVTQASIVKASTHFNPVELVCGMYDYKGAKFDLMDYRNLEQGFITTKSNNGVELKAMELPGLWNGSMAYWNTIFIEVPLETFSPVKTVNDLLKPEHQPR